MPAHDRQQRDVHYHWFLVAASPERPGESRIVVGFPKDYESDMPLLLLMIRDYYSGV